MGFTTAAIVGGSILGGVVSGLGAMSAASTQAKAIKKGAAQGAEAIIQGGQVISEGELAAAETIAAGEMQSAETLAAAAQAAAQQQATAARQAVRTQQMAARRATTALTQARDEAINELRTSLEQVQGYQQPYMEVGTGALQSLSDLYGLGPGGEAFGENALEAFRNYPGYQFALQEGIGALDKSAAAKGLLLSGGQIKDVTAFATGLADQTFGQYVQQLMNMALMGQSSANVAGQATLQTGANIANVQTGTAANLANTELGFSRGIAASQQDVGNALAAGTLGAGQAMSTGERNAALALGAGQSNAARAEGNALQQAGQLIGGATQQAGTAQAAGTAGLFNNVGAGLQSAAQNLQTAQFNNALLNYLQSA